MSVLPCFSKILERIVHSRLFKHLTDHEILYPRQFGFQSGHTPEHVITNSTDLIRKSFEKDCFTLGIVIDLSETFDTMDNEILLRKVEMYSSRGTNHA